MRSKKAFGLQLLGKKIPELLKIKVKDKQNPDKWNWIPAKPQKIKDIQSHIKKEREATSYSIITNYERGPYTQNVVLVFSIGNLSYSLIENLKKERLKFIYLDFVQFILNGRIDIQLSNINSKRLLLFEDAVFDLADISVVVWNPPKYPNPLFDFEMIPANAGRHDYLFKKRWMQFLRDLKHLVREDCVWLPSDPLNGSQEWQNKIGEYLLAQNIGLKIPPTIFTNDLDSLHSFKQMHGDDILLREFCCPPFSFPPISLKGQKINFDDLENSPCSFQAYVEKQFELRVILMFDKVFPCKIHSQSSKLTQRDWRVHDDANVKWELGTIPKSLEVKLVKLQKKLGLNWMSVDLIFTNSGEYVFLEANRPGAHYWLDLFIGLDISKEIVLSIRDQGLIDKIE
jgi:hypothetical protein